MKSSKLKATLAAVSAIAVMASASTSFAATVTTISTYNTDDANKVSVTAIVADATSNKEVTYLVNNGAGDIVYIDQATITNGTATFAYKIDKSKIAGFTTSVKYGTDGSDTFADAATSLGFGAVAATGDDNATITYYTDADCKNVAVAYNGKYATGNNDKIYAKVAVSDDYAVATATINGVDTTVTENNIYKLTAGQTLAVTTKKTTVDPVVVPADTSSDVAESETVKVDDKDVPVVAAVKTVLKINTTDNIEYGVIYNGTAYPALGAQNGYAAVRILTTIEGETIAVNDVIPYYLKDGVYYNANTNEVYTK